MRALEQRDHPRDPAGGKRTKTDGWWERRSSSAAQRQQQQRRSQASSARIFTRVTHRRPSAVWDNDGETAFLLEPNGNIVHFWQAPRRTRIVYGLQHMGYEWQTFDQQKRLEASVGGSGESVPSSGRRWARKMMPLLMTIAIVAGFWFVYVWVTS